MKNAGRVFELKILCTKCRSALLGKKANSFLGGDAQGQTLSSPGYQRAVSYPASPGTILKMGRDPYLLCA